MLASPMLHVYWMVHWSIVPWYIGPLYHDKYPIYDTLVKHWSIVQGDIGPLYRVHWSLTLAPFVAISLALPLKCPVSTIVSSGSTDRHVIGDIWLAGGTTEINSNNYTKPNTTVATKTNIHNCHAFIHVHVHVYKMATLLVQGNEAAWTCPVLPHTHTVWRDERVGLQIPQLDNPIAITTAQPHSYTNKRTLKPMKIILEKQQYQQQNLRA